MLAAVLAAAGHRTGCTTSPHLVSFTERMEVDGEPASRGEVADLLARLRPHVEALDAEGEPPTFFEVATAAAFLHFADAGVAWAVVEAGMGGRLDATNVVRPEVAVITNVSLDHQRHLGQTVPEIAWEKAGIMKEGVPVVTAATGEALMVLTVRSHQVHAPMSIVGGDYTVVPDPDHLVLLRPNGESRYEVGLAGPHQHENAALVVACVEALRLRGHDLPERALREGLRQVRHPGRLQRFDLDAARLAPGAPSRPVSVLVDGAHNVAAAEALRQALFAMGWSGYHLVAGFCSDKDWQESLEAWLPPCAHLWAVPVRNPRSLDPGHLVALGLEGGVRSEAAAGLAKALRRAVEAGAQRILVAGSLFLAGEAVATLTGRSLEEIRGSQ
jgi:dihydrofolate synthase / folylpolyglutamate synthase